MNKKLTTLVTASVMVAGPLVFAYSDASPTVFPDYGAWREAERQPQKVRLVSPTPATTPVSEEDAARLREKQLKAALEALGMTVD